MNPLAVLALLGWLFEQVSALEKENAALREQVSQRTEAP